MAKRNAMHVPKTPEEEFGQSEEEYYDQKAAQDAAAAPAATGQSTGEYFTREQVDGILTEREDQLQRHFQSQMTPVWQDRAELKERMDELERSLRTTAQVGPSSASAEPALDPGKPEDWTDLKDGVDLYHKTERMLDAKLAAVQGKPAAEESWQMRDDDERDEMLGELAVNQAIGEMKNAYPWMNDGHVRQVLQVAHDRDVYDFDMVAASVYGPPGSKPTNPQALGIEPTGVTHDYRLPPRPETFRSQTLVGSSRSAATGASVSDEIQLRRGMEGWGDAETGLQDWAKRSGKE